MSKYFKLLGATRTDYMWSSRYIMKARGVLEDTVLDSMEDISDGTGYAGAG